MKPDLCYINYKLNSLSLYDSLQTFLIKKQGIEKVHKKKYMTCLKVIISNTALAVGDERVVLPTCEQLSCPRRYNQYNISRHVFLNVLAFLEFSEMIELGEEEGFQWLKPLAKFKELFEPSGKYVYDRQELIILKDKDKKLIDYKDNRQTRLCRNMIQSYNHLLNSWRITLDGKPLINTYKRVFNRDFQSGGRYYGASAQQLSHNDRVRLKINGEPCVEIDFKGMQAAMLLAKKGLPLDYDPYGFTEDRALGKKVLNTILCCDNAETARKSIQNQVNLGKLKLERGETARGLIEQARGWNYQIADMFYVNDGLASMFTESEIATDIISTATSLDIPVLCIHDGMVCKESDSYVVRRVMAEAFGEVLNYQGDVYMTQESATGKELHVISLEDNSKQYTHKGIRMFKRG